MAWDLYKGNAETVEELNNHCRIQTGGVSTSLSPMSVGLSLQSHKYLQSSFNFVKISTYFVLICTEFLRSYDTN